MNKFFRNVLCIVFAVSMIASLSLSAFADESDSLEDYFSFVSQSQSEIMPLMDDTGDFTFEIKFRTDSPYFIADSDSLTISTISQFYCLQTDSYDNTARKYTITLYQDKILFDKKIGTLTAFSDNETYSDTFSVTEGKTYYIRVAVSTSLVNTAFSIVGRGNVSPITLK